MVPYDIDEVLTEQKFFFSRGTTLDIKFRKKALKSLRTSIIKNKKRIFEALWNDLHKSEFEAYATEIGLVLEEINLHLRNLSRWASPEYKYSSLAHFKSDAKIYSEPYGNVLIIAPWNYPFQLLFTPLVGAISAGNTVILKPSPYTPNTQDVMVDIINETFDSNYVAIFTGGREVNKKLLSRKYDLIFFTGSPYLGKIVMQSAAENLTPVVLELGGKSPCIIDFDANVTLAAKRIVWGKLINAGQTCIAPDYFFVHKKIKEKFLNKLVYYIEKFYGTDPQKSPDYPRIVNAANIERLRSLTEHGEIYYGGYYDSEDRYFQPTIIDKVKPEYPIMKQEIFGPLFPIMDFEDLNNVIEYVNSHPKPLAFYYFSNNRRKQKYVLKYTTSGGGCINDTVMHFANSNLPFGGVGNSGMGRYHGKYSFDTFSNKRSIIRKSNYIDVPVRYAPFNKLKQKIVELLIK